MQWEEWQQIPIKNNEEENELAYAKVRADKEREVKNAGT